VMVGARPYLENATWTCSSLPPSRVCVTVIDVPVPATLTEFIGFLALH
jgi:hypothetical protein